MSMAGEAAFSAFLELFAKLASYDHLLNFVTEKQVNQHLKEWQRLLPSIQAVVNNAEQKQMKDQNVKNWLAQLHGLAYDVDDILDEFAMEALHRKLHLHEDQASSSKVWIPISTWFTRFTNPSAFNFSKKMISKFEKISLGLNGLATQKWGLGLRKINGGAMFKARKASLQPRALVDETHVYGREKEKAEILEFLLSQNGKENGVSMLQIVGVGGIGKTTLTQLVYNDSSIEKSFDHKAWICVSKDFDAILVTLKILQSITAKSCTCTSHELQNLQAALKDKLLGTRFLLVLDNVWDENFNDLSILLKPFGVGTKIILTTRSCKVSSVVSNAEAYPLQQLSDKDCLSVLTQNALNASDFSGHPELEKVGMKIARNCNGLPLAAKVIGGLLCTNLDYGVWKDISESGIWDLTEDQCGVNPALLLSYLHLPPCLKRCFSYCSILPKDYDFEEEEIILLWKAEGFLQEANLKTQMEGLGRKYFQELVSRSFFQTSSRDKSRFVMHDLFNGLADFVAGEICFKLEGNEKPEVCEATRHSSYVRGLKEGAKKFEPFGQMKHLRTFLPIMMSSTNEVCYLTNTVLIDLLPKLTCLRVLSLKGYSIDVLPNSFENLIHLRHLDFSYTNIRSLPASVFTLYNLETLLLKKCQCLEELSSEIDHLVNLNHLDISGADSLKRMPSEIGKLTNLQRLSNFILAVDGWLQIQDLKNLVHLKGDLSLSGLESIIKAEDACEAKLIDKSGLEGLCLMWSNNFDSYGRNKAVFEEEVLNILEPHRMLKTLSIENYGGAKFSNWMLDSSLKNLLSLTLNNCRNCKSLPPLGKLPLLKDLSIRGMHEVNKVGIEFCGDDESNAFASLEMLCLEDLPNWKEWDFDEVAKFPCLRHLCIRNCPQLLGRLPKSVHSLEELIILRCPKLVVSVSNLPMLHELEIDGCAELVLRDYADFPTLKKVSLSSISKFCFSRLESQQYLETNGCNELTSLLGSLGHLRSLQNLEILSFPQSVSLDAGEAKEEQLQLGKLCSIKSLTIRNYERLERLTQYLHFLTFLTTMRIGGCPCIVSVSVNNFPPSLKMLVIEGCMNLQFLVDEGENASISSTETALLEHLEVINCPSLNSLSLPKRLQTLIISRCSKLVSLSTSGMLPTGLKQMSIFNCLCLESIVQEIHENSCLEYLRIWGCNKLKSLPKGLNKLKHVEEMDICDCESLFFLTESGLPTTNLTVLSICDCPNLVTLPNTQNLTALKELSLSRCSRRISFGGVGFPTSLTSLTIIVPSLSSSLLKWGLHKLTSLRFLYINGEECPDVVSFPLEGKGTMLPPSLTSITLEKFDNLKYLSSKGFRNLTSLQELWVLECSKLESLPEKDMLLSLSLLYIRGCPLLGNECMWERGREWSKICHIPEVRVDHQFIIPKPSWYWGGQP